MTLYHPGERASEVGPNFTLRLSAEDLRRGYVNLPLALAVRNIGRRDLDAVKLVIRYPRGLNVQASGKLHIDPSKQALGGLAVLGGLLYTARIFRLSREGQLTERYTKAIEQLGSGTLDVRLGAIYALERLAHD